MGNQLNDCCHTTINTASDVNDLRHQTSGSFGLMEEARKSTSYKSHSTPKSSSIEVLSPVAPNTHTSKSRYTFSIFTKNSRLKLQSIDSSRSIILSGTNNNDKINHKGHGHHHEHPNLSTSVSEETIYSLVTTPDSDGDKDQELTYEIVMELKKNEKAVSIETTSCQPCITQSRTIAADHQTNLETAKVVKSDNNHKIISTGSNDNNNNGFFSVNSNKSKSQSVHKKKNKYKEIMKQKNKSNIYSMGKLKEELSEIEIQLKQCEHQKDVLKKENEALRATIQAFHNKFGDIVGSGFELNELFAKTHINTKSISSLDKGYTVTPSNHDDTNGLLSPKDYHGILTPSITPPPSAPTICESHEEIIIVDDKSSDDKCVSNTPRQLNQTPSVLSSTPGTPIAINWNNSTPNDHTQNVFFTANGDKKLGINSYKSPSHHSNDTVLPSPSNNPSSITSSRSANSDSSSNETTKVNYNNHNHDDTALTLTLTQMASRLSSPRSSVGTVHNVRLLSPKKRRSASVPVFDTKKISASGSMFTGDISYDDEKAQQFQFDTSCNGDIDDCMAIHRIISALKWYAISGNDHELLYKKMKKDNYGKQIVNDYNHIMEYHLNDYGKTNREIRMEYDLIVNMVHKQVGDCKFLNCAGYRRYLRGKNSDIGHGVHKAQNKEQHELQMYVNTMDGIHCCFMHLAKRIWT